MAAGIDILLRLIGDARSAVQSFNQTTDAAKQTEDQVERTSQQTQTFGQRVGRFLNTIPGMVGGITAALATVEQVLSGINDFLLSGKAEAAAERLKLAASPEEEAAALAQAAQVEARKRKLSLFDPRTWTPENIFADTGSLAAELFGLGRRARREREERELRRLLIGMSAEDVSRLAPYLPEAARLAPRVARAQAYRRGEVPGLPLSQQGYPSPTWDRTVVNINMGVGDGQRAGEEARAILDRRDRNNGYYQTTYNRPGR